ncbi:FAD-dependent oxidoreductase [Candidatus Woesearchaeota archaeon]|jgi:thioredoxin reductase (NADPH)|nr:FAD-dependent oxidoreductase [Candidatus Woesearchaeota archaeon]
MSDDSVDSKNKVYDLVIMGAGAAGYTCAIYAARYKLDSVVIGKEPGGIATTAHDIENWPGKTGSGIEIMDGFKDHVEKFKVPIIFEEIQEVMKETTSEGVEVYRVQTDKTSYLGKTILIALGTKRRKLEIEGEADYEGKGVSYCATCDGFFFKDKVVGVVGAGDAAAMATQMLSEIAKKVYIIYRKDNLTTEPARAEDIHNDSKVELVPKSNVVKFYGSPMLQGVELDSGRKIEMDGLFIEIGGIPLSNFAKALGVTVDERSDRIVVDSEMKTNVPGVFSAGDISTGSGGFNQIVIAAAEGALAARSAFKFIRASKSKK